MTLTGDDKRLVVVTGKGGTGAHHGGGRPRAGRGAGGPAHDRRARSAARRGPAAAGRRRGRPREPADERPLSPGLWSTTIDPEIALEEWLGRQLPRRLAGMLARSGAFAGFVGAAPGARELVTITKAWELGQARRWRRDAAGYDTVVLDAPASGHGVGLLRTPRTFADIARVGPIAGQARAVAEALADPARTPVVAVALPGRAVGGETLELETRVQATLGRPLDAIVVNGVWPRRLAGARGRGDSRRATARSARRTGGVAAASAGRVRAQQQPARAPAPRGVGADTARCRSCSPTRPRASSTIRAFSERLARPN